MGSLQSGRSFRQASLWVLYTPRIQALYLLENYLDKYTSKMLLLEKFKSPSFRKRFKKLIISQANTKKPPPLRKPPPYLSGSQNFFDWQSIYMSPEIIDYVYSYIILTYICMNQIDHGLIFLYHFVYVLFFLCASSKN